MSQEEDTSTTQQELLLFLADELSPAQRAAFERRLENDPSLQAQLNDLEGIDAQLKTDVIAMAAPQFISDRALKQSLRLAREHATSISAASYANRQPFRIPTYAKVAATFAVLVLGFVGWLFTTSPISSTDQMATRSNPTASNPAFSDRGNAPLPLAGAFGTIGVDQYSESSREIESQIDALSQLAEFEDAGLN